jgi:Flp pilus assembly protein CpaB
VLSAGQTTQTDGKSQSILTPVVTLLVNPQEAEALTLANNEGRIQLVLRNSTDGVIAATRGRRMREIFGAPAEEEPAPRPASAPARVSAHAASAHAPVPETAEEPHAPELEEHRIFIYQGTAQTVTTFRGGVRESSGERGK